MIRDYRTTLFGRFSSSITSKHKQEVWNTITQKAIDQGLILANKDAKYLRDVFWQNIRRKTIKKMDDARKSGDAGGSNMILDDVDNLVIDIIGEIL